MAYAWENPSTAAVRVPVNVDDNGNIAIGDATVAGAKSQSFSSTAMSTTAAEFFASPADGSVEGQVRGGTAYTFLAYLLGGSYDALSAKRTIIQSVEEAA